MVALNKKTVVSYCLLISKISLPVHNFIIRMLLIINNYKDRVVNPIKAGGGHNALWFKGGVTWSLRCCC